MAMDNILSNFNSVSLDDMNKGKIRIIELNFIKENALNIFSQNEIEELKENIKENGLFSPINVIKDGNNYKIISGHRRFKAIKAISEEDGSDGYTFAGRKLGKAIPVIVMANIDSNSEIKERIALVSANSHRDIKRDEKRNVVKEVNEIYEMLVTNGEKPKGRKREWISEITGFGSASVSEYLEELGLTKTDKVSQDKGLKKILENDYKKVEKSVSKTFELLMNIELNELEKDEIADLYEKLQELQALSESVLEDIVKVNDSEVENGYFR